MTRVPLRPLGRNGPPVASIGYGTMGLSMAYGSIPSDTERMALLTRCIELGSTHIDTADVYADSEVLIGRWLADSSPEMRPKIFLATKFGIVHDQMTGEVCARGDKAYVRERIENSLSRLGVDYIDMVYVHRIDKTVPIEETVKVMKEFVEEGKVRHIGLSECSASTLRRAHAVYPIAACQVEFSPFALEIEHNGVLEACRELGIAVVAYSPLGRGMLTGKYSSRGDFEEADLRHRMPRFSDENFPKNMVLVEKIAAMAKRKGCTPGQLTMAWILAQGEDFFVIPGTKRAELLEENIGAASVKLSNEDVAEIRKYAEECTPAGERPWKTHLAFLDSAPPETMAQNKQHGAEDLEALEELVQGHH